MRRECVVGMGGQHAEEREHAGRLAGRGRLRLLTAARNLLCFA